MVAAVVTGTPTKVWAAVTGSIVVPYVLSGAIAARLAARACTRATLSARSWTR